MSVHLRYVVNRLRGNAKLPMLHKMQLSSDGMHESVGRTRALDKRKPTIKDGHTRAFTVSYRWSHRGVHLQIQTV